MRLFLERFEGAGNEPLPNDHTGVSIGIPPKMTLRTEAERRARGIALFGLPLGVANNQALATSAFSGRIAGADPAGDDPRVIRLILRIFEDTPLHPERSLRVPPAAILALFRFEVSQVFKHQNGSPLLTGELDNAGAHQMRKVLIGVADLAPEIGVVLFPFGHDASLGSVACNAS